MKKKSVNHAALERLRKVEDDIRLGKFDNLLLFASSSVGLLFTVVQYLLSEIAGALFLPLVVLGIIIPVYFGYFRGVLQNSTANRVRGWIHFFLGIGTYIWFTVVAVFVFHLQVRDTLPLLVPSGLAFAVFWVISQRLIAKVSSLYSYSLTRKDKGIVFSSIMAAVFYVAGSLFIYLGYLLSPLYMFNLLGTICAIVFLVGASIILYLIPIKFGFYRDW